MRIILKYEDGPDLGQVSFDDEIEEDDRTREESQAAEVYYELIAKGEIPGQWFGSGTDGSISHFYEAYRRVVDETKQEITVYLRGTPWAG